MNIEISIEVYYLQTHIYKNKTDLNMRTILGKKKVNHLYTDDIQVHAKQNFSTIQMVCICTCTFVF